MRSVAKDFKRAFESLLLLERRWAARTARVYSAAATFEAMVLPKMRSELRREREAMGSCFMQIVVGSATMRDGASWKSAPRLCNSTKKFCRLAAVFCICSEACVRIGGSEAREAECSVNSVHATGLTIPLNITAHLFLLLLHISPIFGN
jgi:hypothetical protein